MRKIMGGEGWWMENYIFSFNYGSITAAELLSNS